MENIRKKRENFLKDVPESHQRYLCKFYDISRRNRGGWMTNKEIAEALEVEPASVTAMLKKLKKKNLVLWNPRKAIRLTAKGKTIAIQVSEIYKLLCFFFNNVLKLEDRTLAEELSYEIEPHIYNPKVIVSLKEFLAPCLEQYINSKIQIEK